MKRRAIRVAAAVSLVLFVVIATLAVRSLNWRSDNLQYAGVRWSGYVTSSSAKLFFIVHVWDAPRRYGGWDFQTDRARNYRPSPGIMPRRFSFLGPGGGPRHNQSSGVRHSHLLGGPAWGWPAP